MVRSIERPGIFDIARFAGDDLQPQPQIGIAGIVPTMRLHQIARREHGGDVASQPAHAAGIGGQDHMGETRMPDRNAPSRGRVPSPAPHRPAHRAASTDRALGDRRHRAAGRARRVARRPRPRRQVRGPAARDRWPGFPARNTAPTPCARPRAKGDNRCRALDGRRGRGADRPKPARPSPFPAASCRRAGRSAARASVRHR